jgi:hypothetical protein
VAEGAKMLKPNKHRAAVIQTHSERLAAAAAYAEMWCNPAQYRRQLQRELRRNIAIMRQQRLERVKRRDALLSWLRLYEAWRETHGRPIAYLEPAAIAAE